MTWIDGNMAAMSPHAGAADCVNYLSSDDPARVRAAYGAHYTRLAMLKHTRLAMLKRRYDPDNTFRGNRNIEPA
jgi:hypothetical protein